MTISGERSRRHCIRRLAALAAAVALAAPMLAAAPAAGQDDPTSGQYDDTVTQVEERVGPGEPAGSEPVQSGERAASKPPAATGGGSLPLTGGDLAVIGAVALALLASGAALRRLSAPRSRP